MSINEVIKANLEKFQDVDVRDFQEKIVSEYAEIGDHVIYGGKYAGSDAERTGAKYIKKVLEEIGVDTVELVEFDSIRYQGRDMDMEIIEGSKKGVKFKPGPYPTPGTSPEGISAEIVYAGNATPEYFEANDVKGKVVFIESQPGLAGNSHGFQIWEAEAAGAVAVVVLHTDNNIDDTTLRSGTFMKMPGIPVVGLNTADANVLRESMAASKTVIKLIADAEYSREGKSTGVIAEIKGKTDERIVFSGHIDHYFKCLQDNIASVCEMLGIAKKVIDSGYKPNRTLTFMFTSSHEVSGKESLNPYIYGSYVMLVEKHPEWIKKIMYDINFEYPALDEKSLRSYGSPEIEAKYNEFIEYMPSENPGFDEVARDFDPSGYILMAWEDSVSYVSYGVTCIANDPISEQMAGDSPYVGRDHSTSDNRDAWSAEALNSTTNWYGSLGLYLDQTPIPELDFTARTERLRFTDDEMGVVAGTDFNVNEYNKVLDDIAEKSGKIHKALIARNGEKTEVTEDDIKITEELIDIRHKYSALTDTFNAQGFFSPHIKNYIMSVALLGGGITMLEAGDLEGAMNNCLMFEGYIGIAYTYGPATGKKLAELAADDDSRTWNRGKTPTIIVLPETADSLRRKRNAGITDFADEIKILKEVMASESELMMKTMNETMETLKEINRDMGGFLESLEK